MRRWIGWAAHLYPAAWRRRYGAEFNALLDDSSPRWRDLADVIRGALTMQLTSWKSYGRAAVLAGIAGAIVAAALSFALPNRYESRAVLRFAPDPGTDVAQMQERLERIEMQLLSRGALEQLIADPTLDLYKAERVKAPIDDIAEHMRANDIKIDLYSPLIGRAESIAFVIRFTYPDPYKAQVVARLLAARLSALNTEMSLATPRFPKLDLLQAATLPKRVSPAERALIVGEGLASGLLLGLLANLVWRRPKWSLAMAGFGGAGFALAAAASILFLPNMWTSRAVVRVDADTAWRFGILEQQVLSVDNLMKLIRTPALDLYARQRSRTPMELVTIQMRRDIQFRLSEPRPSGDRVLAISYSYPDRFKAQAVVQRLTSELAQRNSQEAAAGHPDLEVVDSATLPESPASPDRLMIAALGAVLGLIVGAVVLRRRSAPAPPAIEPVPAT